MVQATLARRVDKGMPVDQWRLKVPDNADAQGLIASAYGKLPFSLALFLSIGSSAHGIAEDGTTLRREEWIAELLDGDHVPNAVHVPNGMTYPPRRRANGTRLWPLPLLVRGFGDLAYATPA
jgi:hypothetical protein